MLTSLLVLGGLGSIAGIVGSVLALAALGTHGHGHVHIYASAAALAAARRMLLVALVSCFLQLACVAGIWAWKQWGVYGYVALSGLAMIASYRADHSFSFMALVDIGLVLFATLPKWSYFDA